MKKRPFNNSYRGQGGKRQSSARSNRNWRILPLAVAVVLGGCASDEVLFAEYDFENCLVMTDEGTLAYALPYQQEILQWQPAIYFAFDKSDISSESAKGLDNLVKIMTRYPELNLSVQGYTDFKGSNAYNRALAKRRVDATVGYLEEHGIAPGRLQAFSLGEELPLVGGRSDDSREINRRVELMLLDTNLRALPMGLVVPRGQGEQSGEPEKAGGADQ